MITALILMFGVGSAADLPVDPAMIDDATCKKIQLEAGCDCSCYDLVKQAQYEAEQKQAGVGDDHLGS